MGRDDDRRFAGRRVDGRADGLAHGAADGSAPITAARADGVPFATQAGLDEHGFLQVNLLKDLEFSMLWGVRNGLETARALNLLSEGDDTSMYGDLQARQATLNLVMEIGLG